MLWIVGLTNAFNFLDNMDALSASVGLIASLLFVGAQVAVGSLFVPALLLVLSGALAGFLVHNRPPARLFMGDAGSNFLGFLLGTLTVTGTFTRQGFSPFGVLAPLLVMAVPLYDTTSVILIRLREGRSPFQADRRHFSHRLVDRGLTPGRAVATIDLVTLAAGLGALLLHRLESLWEAAVVAGQTVCLLGVVAILEVSTSSRPEPRSDAQAPIQAPPVEAPSPDLSGPTARPRRRRPLPNRLTSTPRSPSGANAPVSSRSAWPPPCSSPAPAGRESLTTRSTAETAWAGPPWSCVSALLAIASAFLRGSWRIRVTWSDLGVYALFFLVAMSARHAAEARVAFNLAWEWVGVGLCYALLRHLPQGRHELTALAGILVATAVSLSAYGLYQVAVVHPDSQQALPPEPRGRARRRRNSEHARGS